LAITSWGCTQSQNTLPLTNIKADVTSNKEMKLSDYFENFKMVKLSSDSVMGEIKRIRYENDRIYVTDGNSMFVFSNTGKLLHKFSKFGKGPGEYLMIDDFIINGDSIIVLCRNWMSLITYSNSGEYGSACKFEHFPQAISPLVNNSCFIYFGDTYTPTLQHKLQRLRNNREESRYLPADEHRAKNLFVFSTHNFNKHNESIYFFEAYNDTIYKSINGCDMKPFFWVDYAGRNAPASFFTRDFRDMRELNAAFQAEKYARGVFNFAGSDRFLMFSTIYQKNGFFTVFDHVNTISKTYGMLEDDVVFKGLMYPIDEFSFSYHAEGNYIILPLEATKVEEWRKKHAPAEPFKEQINATHWEDNPILLIFDVKK
jgi:hypothetical protein